MKKSIYCLILLFSFSINFGNENFNYTIDAFKKIKETLNAGKYNADKIVTA